MYSVPLAQALARPNGSEHSLATGLLLAWPRSPLALYGDISDDFAKALLESRSQVYQG